MKPYDELALMPRLIAETVCGEPYTGHEISNPCPSMVATVEAGRQQMDVADFASYADARCRMAYENKADWFMKIARSRSNRGRDQLYMYVRHWLAARPTLEVHHCDDIGYRLLIWHDAELEVKQFNPETRRFRYPTAPAPAT